MNSFKMNKIGYVLVFIWLFFAGIRCKAQVITTMATGLSAAGGIAIDDSGNLYVANYGTARVLKINKAGTVTTFAGNGVFTYAGDGGPATAASMYTVLSVAVDLRHNVYIADGSSHVVRKVDSAGIITTFAGNGTAGYSGDGSNAATAQLNLPQGLAVDDTGNVYIADAFTYTIRKVDTAGIITTFAGTGVSGFSADGVTATTARLTSPTAVTVDHSGNVYIADNYRVRKVNATGIISTVAGTGSSGYSGDGGPAISASISYAIGLTTDAMGNIFIADEVNYVVRKIDTAGIITTVAGNGVGAGQGVGYGSYSGDGGPADSAGLKSPAGVVVDRVGNLYISDDNVIRKVSAISGTTHICQGDTITFTVPVAGGAWSSSNPGIASVDTLSGMVTGVAQGTAIIYYSISTDTAATTVFVNGTPTAGIITAIDSTCLGTMVLLTDTISGGMWSLSNANANILGNKVTSMLPGKDTATYRVYYTCGISTAQLPLTFIEADAGTITGPQSVCAGDTIIFSDSVAGGIWNLGDTTIASMISPGIVKATVPGYNEIAYTVTTAIPGCSASSSIYFGIDSASHCAGTGVANVALSSSRPLIYPNPSSGTLYVEAAAINEQRNIAISDMYGRVVFTTIIAANTTKTELNLNVPPGIYILNVQTGSITDMHKIVIE